VFTYKQVFAIDLSPSYKASNPVLVWQSLTGPNMMSNLVHIPLV